MVEIQFRRGKGIAAIAAGLLLMTVSAAAGKDALRDAPVIWYDDDRNDIAEPRRRQPNLLWDGPKETVQRPLVRITRPGRLIRRARSRFGGDHVRFPSDVNSLGEVVNSTWFTNRIGLYPMLPEEAARGPMTGDGPDRSAPWTVVSARTEGVTPGFNIRDAGGDHYLIKFDPPGYLNMTTAAGVVCNRIFHAAGYSVPEDRAVTFTRDLLVLGEGVTIRDKGGKMRLMSEEDLDGILHGVDRLPDGSWLALSSRTIDGTPIGPFDYKGRRKDDPNDRIRHENRRSLRGLRVIAAWVNHFDTGQANTLDTYVEEEGRRFVRHYLIDFASTLGGGASGPAPKNGWEYAADIGEAFGNILTLGFHEAEWRRLERPEGLSEVGYWDSHGFEAEQFEPRLPNPAFADMTHRDGYWAAKIISGFTDDHLEAIVKEAGYRDPRAARHVARVLGERRDIILRRWFSCCAPLEFFRKTGGAVHYRDLGDERNVFPGSVPVYRSRIAAVNNDRDHKGWSSWVESGKRRVELEGGAWRSVSSSEYPFVAMEIQVNRGEGWSPRTTAYFSRATGRTVGVHRSKYRER